MEEPGFTPKLATKSILLTTISVSFATPRASRTVNICREIKITFLFLSSTLYHKHCLTVTMSSRSINSDNFSVTLPTLFQPSTVVCFGSMRIGHHTNSGYKRESIFLFCRETFLKFHSFVKSPREFFF